MITPLRCGVDTLEATFVGEIDSEILDDLEARKRRAQATNTAEEIMVGGSTFHVLPKGAGFWRYVLRNDELIVRLGSSGNVPDMQIRLLAEGLASLGVDELWSKAVEIASEFCLSFNRCSRLDIALDFHGEWFTSEEMINVICPSDYWPVFPNSVNPQTFQFGKGQIVVRLYDKSAEIKANDHGWWVFVWRLCDGFDQSQPVYRAEVQLRGQALTELGFHSVEALTANLPDLFAYGLTWCSLRVPTADTNRSRWPEDPRWTQLRTAFSPSRALGRVRPVRVLIEYDSCVKRFVSLISSAGASVDSTDYWHLAKALTADAEQLIEREMDTTFAALVEVKRKRKYL